MKKIIGPLVAVPCLFLLVLGAFAQEAREEAWKGYMETASQALKDNKPNEAVMAFQAAIGEAERFGPEDTRLASTLFILGKYYFSQDKYFEATMLIRRSISIREINLGADHPEVANTIDTLAGMYVNEGRDNEAEPLLRRSLAIRETAYGQQHPDVDASLNRLAATSR